MKHLIVRKLEPGLPQPLSSAWGADLFRCEYPLTVTGPYFQVFPNSTYPPSSSHVHPQDTQKMRGPGCKGLQDISPTVPLSSVRDCAPCQKMPSCPALPPLPPARHLTTAVLFPWTTGPSFSESTSSLKRSRLHLSTFPLPGLPHPSPSASSRHLLLAGTQ